MVRLKDIALASMLACAFAGCESEEQALDRRPEGAVAVRIAPQGLSDGAASDGENAINTLRGFRFDGGVLEEILEGLSLDGEGVCHILPAQRTGTVYFWTNASEAVKGAGLKEGVTTEDEFLNLRATSEAMTAEGLLMTGRVELSEALASPLTANLKRSVARVDLESLFENVEVHAVSIKNIADSGYVNIRELYSVEDTGKGKDWRKDFGEQAFRNGKETLLYLCEQGEERHAVEVLVSVNGAWRRLTTELPAIRRNTVYTLAVYGNGADARVEVVSGEWMSGPSVDSGLERKGWIDREASQLSDGVTLSERGDTVFVPHWESNFRLALLAETGMTVVVNGRASGTSVTLQDNRSRSMAKVATVDVASARKIPGNLHTEYVYLDLCRETVRAGRIVLAFAPSPIRITGLVRFDENGVCDFERYVDGRLAEIALPEGMKAVLEAESGDVQWAKLYEGENVGVYTLEGGWRPNDPEADGRPQTIKLIISGDDGAHAETYVIKRRNWGLPVVNVNGTWWCKYNLRGNARRFEDQILVKNEPVAGDDGLAEYLRTCTDKELLAILGDQYQGGNADGLKLAYDGANFYYEGFKPEAEDFGTIAPAEMAPDGYEIPDYDDFRFFAWGNDCALGHGSNSFNNQLGQRLTYTITNRNLTFEGADYGSVNVYDFDYEGSHWVMASLGHQWKEREAGTVSVSKMFFLMATSGRAGKTWAIEGYLAGSAQGQSSWIKYADHNKVKTRTIRCVKTPVKYIY